uniref:HLF transcription factor, PAR bZIP family member n=1 Tax=Meleagris gallopavo TaxID=9103 RepID=G3UT79_MELGA
MDLEEFLSENGIPPSPNQHEHSPHQPGLQQATSASPSVMDLSSRASTSVHPGMVSQNCMQSPVRPGQILPTNRNTPSPIDPETIQVPVGYEPDPADLALSSIPGQEMFDPRKRKFSEEELKPQPMIKKARKVFIPDDLKDDKYWARRRKNNMAAKRSRDARRLKENQIAIRASFLEKENSALRQEVADLRKELGKCKNVLANRVLLSVGVGRVLLPLLPHTLLSCGGFLMYYRHTAQVMGPNRKYPRFMRPYFPAHLNTHTYKRIHSLSVHAVHTYTHTHTHTHTVYTRTTDKR